MSDTRAGDRAAFFFLGAAIGAAAADRQMERRSATLSFPAYTLQLEKHWIPADAILEDFRNGLGHEGLQPKNPRVASFHYDGKVYFNLWDEIAGKTRVERLLD